MTLMYVYQVDRANRDEVRFPRQPTPDAAADRRWLSDTIAVLCVFTYLMLVTCVGVPGQRE